MNDEQPTVPYGYCHCGCGRKTRISPRTDTRVGHVQGQPLRFLRGHRSHAQFVPKPSNPTLLCQCGCGGLAPIVTKTDRRAGWVTGTPKRYIQGHHQRIAPELMPSEPPNPSGLCMCGCGQRTAIARQNSAVYGTLKGHPKRYVHGHQARNPNRPRWLPEDRGYETPCHIWQMGVSDKGYGYDGKCLAHRVAWINANGPIPDGLYVCHHCDQPPCVNVEHLFLGTHQDNMDDMATKGRRCGERAAQVKLTAPQVREIREMLRTGVTQRAAGAAFGVARTTVADIARGRTWWREQACAD